MNSKTYKPIHANKLAQSIWKARIKHPLCGRDNALRQFAVFAKLRHEHLRLRDQGKCDGDEQRDGE